MQQGTTVFASTGDFDQTASERALWDVMRITGNEGATHGPLLACGSPACPAFHAATVLPDGTAVDVLVEYDSETGNIRYEIG